MGHKESYTEDLLRSRIQVLLSRGRGAADEKTVEELVQEVNIYYQELEFQNDELKRIREQLEHSQARYKELYDNAPVGFVGYFDDLRIHRANRTFCSYVGADDPEGKFVHSFIRPDSQDEFYFHVKEVLRTGQPQVTHLWIPAQGPSRYVRMESNLLEVDGRRLVRSALSDVTVEYKLAQELSEANAELRRFQDRLSGVMLAGNLAWWQMDVRTGEVLFSDNKVRILGRDPANFRHYEDFTRLLHPEDYGRTMEEMRACIRGEGLYEVDYRIRAADGSYRWLNDIGMVTSRDGGGAPLMVSGIAVDITERKNALRAAEENERAVALSERKLRTYLDNIPQPVVITDPQGSIRDVNAALLDLYGYRREEVLGQNPRILNPGKDVYRDLGFGEREYEAIFRSLWKDASDPAKGFWEGTIVNRKADGSLLWVKLLVRTVFDELGEPECIVALPVDISNARTAERKSRLELYRTLASLSELRDNETGNHMRRVGLLARRLAAVLGMPGKYCDDIELFAPMHDIGKVGIPDSLLLAPRKLTPQEFEEMKRHTVLGHDILAGKEELAMAADITLSHHEKWNGSGYPHGLAGDSIPLSARIAAVVDVYDALRSRRPYKEPWEHSDAVREVSAASGTSFDPALVEAFLEMERTFESIYWELRD